MALPLDKYKSKKPIRVKCILNTAEDTVEFKQYDNLETMIKKMILLLKSKNR